MDDKPSPKWAWSGHVNHLNFGGHQPYLWNGCIDWLFSCMKFFRAHRLTKVSVVAAKLWNATTCLSATFCSSSDTEAVQAWRIAEHWILGRWHQMSGSWLWQRMNVQMNSYETTVGRIMKLRTSSPESPTRRRGLQCQMLLNNQGSVINI